MAENPSLYDILNANDFRERVYGSFGKSFAFWIGRKGGYSKDIYFDSLNPEFIKVQKSLEDNVVIPKNESELDEHIRKGAIRWQKYACKEASLLSKNAPISEQPWMLVRIIYDPYPMELRTYLLSNNHFKADDYLSSRILPTYSDALVMHRLKRINPLYLCMRHGDKKPATGYFSVIHMPKITSGINTVQTCFLINTLKMTGGFESIKQPPVSKWVNFAAILIDPENGLVESPEEIKKELSVFK